MKHDDTPNRKDMPLTSDGMRMRTFLLMALFLIAGFGVLLYQLYALQLRDAEIYRTEAVEQQMKDTTLPATRGSIYGATGKLLAKSTTVWNIIADPSVSANVDKAYLRQASEEIAAILNDGTTAESLYEKLTDSAMQYKILAKGVEKPVADAILEFSSGFRLPDKDGNAGKGNYILSLWTEQSSVRSYPYGAFLSSVLGFCDGEGNGMYGLEYSYNDVLAGTPGRSLAMTNVNGEVLDSGESVVYDALDGSNLILTIDENVQSIVEEYLQKAVDDFDAHNRGCAIVMNVKTGAILAMASVEQFDPNDPYRIYDETMSTILEEGALTAETSDILQQRLGESETAGIVQDGQISDEEYTQVQGMMREAQWKNKNITELYYPGSVFKLITASAALDSGLASPAQNYFCSGAFTVDPDPDWEHT
ncbi:MAG: penicillin-binding transpeptidase domain-containing protein, partial [Gemmiger sp.]